MDLYRFEWLARRVEEPVDRTRKIVDAHHHLWDNRSGTYLADELLADITGSHNVLATVFVECRAKYDRNTTRALAPVGETRFVAEQAAVVRGSTAGGGARIGAIVSHADMMLGRAVEDVLSAHAEAGQGLFRGIRHAVSWDSHPEVPDGHSDPTRSMMMTPEFVAGVQTLGEMGFSFDSWLYHPQLPELTALARAAAGTSIVCNHLGGPLGIGPHARDHAGAMAGWRAFMTELATCENVTLKVGGIGMESYFGTSWGAEDRPPDSDAVVEAWGDRVRFCIDTFGPDRCMFESNYPVDRQVLPYSVLWNALQKLASVYDEGEQDRLFSGTAIEVYRMDPLP